MFVLLINLNQYIIRSCGVAREGKGVYHAPGATRRGARQMVLKINKILYYNILLYVFLEREEGRQ